MVFMYFMMYFLCIFVYFLHRVFICVPSCTNFIINKFKNVIELTERSVQDGMQTSFARRKQNICHPVVLPVCTETLQAKHSGL